MIPASERLLFDEGSFENVFEVQRRKNQPLGTSTTAHLHAVFLARCSYHLPHTWSFAGLLESLLRESNDRNVSK